MYTHLFIGSAHGVNIIIIRNEHVNSSSNLGQDCFHFT